jgi:hypothetical protein
MSTMIRIERGAEVGPGIWEYHAADTARWPLVSGKSRQPLLDACRQLKLIHGLTAQLVGVFRNGSEIADISCAVKVGAATTVSEPDSGGGPRFVKFREYPMQEVAGHRPANRAA